MGYHCCRCRLIHCAVTLDLGAIVSDDALVGKSALWSDSVQSGPLCRSDFKGQEGSSRSAGCSWCIPLLRESDPPCNLCCHGDCFFSFNFLHTLRRAWEISMFINCLSAWPHSLNPFCSLEDARGGRRGPLVLQGQPLLCGQGVSDGCSAPSVAPYLTLSTSPVHW